MIAMEDKGFHALENCYSDIARAKVVVVPFGYAIDVKETKEAPQRIINASHSVESFDESRMAPGDPIFDIYSASPKKELDRGERLKINGLATLVDLNDGKLEREELIRQFTDVIQTLVGANKIPIILGGDHNVTPLAISAIKNTYSNLAVLHFDSRLDLLSEGQDNDSNRSVMRKIFPHVDSIVSVGFRSVRREEMQFMRQNSGKIHGIMMRGQLRPPWESLTALRNIARYLKDKNVYITFDTSFLDPSTIGHTAKTPEPGGMTFDETLDVWVKLLPEINIVGADFVEYCPTKHFAPDYAFAKLISRFISRLSIRG